ncbi:acyl carrier protein [Magnetococcus sp. PR-3]|uniref:acyl carrier protein n=1 Tax=Magnetococcus sp. PR-3 TaxID=3120355 RepID=UPI002FCE62CD
MDKPQAIERIQSYLQETTEHWPEPDTNLFLEGILDSFAMVELLGFLESSFPVTLNREDIGLDNFATVADIVDFLAENED